MSLIANINLRAMSAAHSLNLSQVALSGMLSQVFSGSCGTKATKVVSAAVGSTDTMNLGTTARSGRQGMRNANDGLPVNQATVAATKEVLTIPGGAGEMSVESNFVAVQGRADSSFPSMSAYLESLSGAASQLLNAVSAHEDAEMSRLQAMQHPCVVALSQVKGINKSVVSALR